MLFKVKRRWGSVVAYMHEMKKIGGAVHQRKGLSIISYVYEKNRALISIVQHEITQPFITISYRSAWHGTREGKILLL